MAGQWIGWKRSATNNTGHRHQLCQVTSVTPKDFERLPDCRLFKSFGVISLRL